MNKITMDMIRTRVAYLNAISKGTKFSIGGAYGGHRLERVYENTGCKGYTPYTSKRELLNYINAFIDGIEFINNI